MQLHTGRVCDPIESAWAPREIHGLFKNIRAPERFMRILWSPTHKRLPAGRQRSASNPPRNIPVPVPVRGFRMKQIAGD